MSATPIEQVLNALRTVGKEPRPSGHGWSCRCPAHDDRNPSLSISEADDGRVLLHCHAGCEPADVCGALGLKLSDLYVRNPHWRPERRDSSLVTSGKQRKPPVRKSASKSTAICFASAEEALGEAIRANGNTAGHWDYFDAKGELVGIVLRFDSPLDPNKPELKPAKWFFPVSRVAEGWKFVGMPSPRPLYQLPDLLAASPTETVYVCEGEKAVEAARALGLVATTSPHGSKSAKQADWSALKGRFVAVLVDHDEAGEKYGEDVKRLALAAGAKSVKIVRLAELWAEMPKGGDIVDFLEHKGGDVESTRSDIESLAAQTSDESLSTDSGASLKFVQFPVDALPEPIRSFATQAANAVGCDPTYIILPLLSALAAAVGNTHRIKLKHLWSEPSILWTAIVGESGSAKSPALEIALRPVRKRQQESLKEHAEEMKKHADAITLHERDLAQWKRSKSDIPPPEKPEAPTAIRYWTDDATTEALAVLLQQNWRGLLMVRDELAGWFNFDRYAQGKGGDVAKWLEMFGGRSMIVDRKTSGTIHVERAAVCIAGGIQPATLRRALSQEYRDNGLAARLLFAMPPRKAKVWKEADVDPSVDAAVNALFDGLYSLNPVVDAKGDQRPHFLEFSADAKVVWAVFYNEHNSEQVNLSGDDAAAWSKLEGYTARFALLIHLIRRITGDPTLENEDQVDAASLRAAISLVRWFGAEAKRVYAILGEDDESGGRRRLIEWIEAKGGSTTVRELSRGPREHRQPGAAFAALQELVNEGLGRWELPNNGNNGGRPSDRFTLFKRGDNGDGDKTPSDKPKNDSSVAVASVASSKPVVGDWGDV